ncbi:jg7415 [Pararge aegeria aegeria]|uniref:Jg7415 protein n=1 Tax=Pararge aegeria aegeria TaxID=348720 RepID=A0A8S4RP80_9NEOP|nr:jg7415 [Pararge aegeria aegeria]
MLLLQSQPIVPPKIPIWQPSFDVSFMTNGPDTKSSKKPGKNQFLASSSVSSFSSSSNKDGVPHYEGVANVIQNVDGKVDQQTILISDN